jgi:hypothetical protein
MINVYKSMEGLAGKGGGWDCSPPVKELFFLTKERKAVSA